MYYFSEEERKEIDADIKRAREKNGHKISQMAKIFRN